ncbi:FG-GAP repeat domain-containing protein [Micromonospora zamorensis]|uniref:FG-GAP repeat domain-containing protein n=1 Tax=Micromonospora zamorensis TaxID=709883 RepID=UPI003797BF26
MRRSKRTSMSSPRTASTSALGVRAVAAMMLTASIVMAPTGSAAAVSKAEPSPTAETGTGTAEPMPTDAYLYIAYSQCVSGGATPADSALADKLRSRMNGDRLGSALNGYNVSCARVIAGTTKSRGLDKRAAVIAVTTAITESTLHNYTEAVDHDSLGLFQQRPSQDWGTPAQITDPVYATNAFLSAMLRKYPNNSWMTGDIGKICQTVQVSAYPDAYAKEVHDAQLLVDNLWTPTPVDQPSRDSSRLRADFTGDGLDDVGLFYDYGDGHVALWVLRGSAGGGLSAPVLWWDDTDWGSNSRYVSAGDFNGDGKADIAMFYQYASPASRVGLWTLSSTGSRFDVPVSRWADDNWGQNTSFMTAGDFNGDGKTDIGLLYSHAEGRTALWTLAADGSDSDGRGFGAPVSRWDDPDFGGNTTNVGAGDFNGDGKSDIALFYGYGSDPHAAVFTLTSTGAGFAAPVLRWDAPLWGNNTQQMAIGKFVNGDNKADIALLYNYGEGHVRLYTLASSTTGNGAIAAPVQRWDDTDFGNGITFMTATQLSSTSYDDIQLFYNHSGPSVAVWSINPNSGAYNTVTRRWFDDNFGGGTSAML